MKKLFLTGMLMLPLAVTVLGQVRKPAPKKPVATVKKPAATAAGTRSASILRGKTVYATYCLTCHQPDGLGVANMNPPLSGTKQVLGAKAPLIRILLNGLNTETEILGETYTNPMPPFNYLKDQEIADVLTYVRNNFKNKASLVTAAEVKAAR